MAKTYTITVNASPRYPMKENFTITAGSWGGAIAKAVKEYFKKHKGLRTDFCQVYAIKIKTERLDENA
jgi:hypothetical protein